MEDKVHYYSYFARNVNDYNEADELDEIPGYKSGLW